MTIRHALPYAPGGRLLDAYLPHAPTHDRPAVVFVHGGGWRSGDRTWYRNPSLWAARRGWVALSIDYRLAPAHPFPAGLDDVRAAVSWVRDHAAELGADPDRIALVGGSAGGNLALLAATADPRLPVVAAASWSGPTDLRTLGPGTGPGTTFDLAGLVEQYLGCRATEPACRTRATAASPAAHLDPADPPLFVANSTDEVIPERQAAAMAGPGTELHLVPGRRHAAGYARDVWPATARFLEARFAKA